MKVKKLLGAALISIPLYFLTPTTAKAEDFKINLKDKQITTEETDYKKGNLLNDFDIGDYLQRSRDRLGKKIFEDRFLLEVSPETRTYLFNWENATRFMNDTEKHIYMEKVNKDAQKIILKVFKKEAQDEAKQSMAYEWFKDETKYYKKRIKNFGDGILDHIWVSKKEVDIEPEGEIKFSYKKEEFKNVSEEEKFKLKFKKTELSVKSKDFFEINLKAKPFSFHSWDYNPGFNVNVFTKHCNIYGKSAYYARDKKLRSSVTTNLPKGYALGLNYDLNLKDETTSLSTTISKAIKGFNLGLSYTKSRDDKNNTSSGTIMFSLDRTW
ncbi:MAG: hypothetical protein Q8O03_03315 [Nanoarchaeota archaeon]|nr:hypothetical protein [Nanoarchaeota archaeon]